MNFLDFAHIVESAMPLGMVYLIARFEMNNLRISIIEKKLDKGGF